MKDYIKVIKIFPISDNKNVGLICETDDCTFDGYVIVKGDKVKIKSAYGNDNPSKSVFITEKNNKITEGEVYFFEK